MQLPTIFQELGMQRAPTGPRIDDVPLGTARWTRWQAINPRPFRPGDFWIGRDGDGQAAGFADDRHVLLVGGTRQGKGTDILAGNIAAWPGSLLVYDPKGENAMVTARRRGNGSAYAVGMGQKVHILDPFDIVRGPQDDLGDLKACFNPLDGLSADREESIDEAARIAEALIVSENAADPFWDDSARGFVKFVILHLATSKDYAPKDRTLVTLRRMLMAGNADAQRLAALSAGDKPPPSGLKLLFGAMKRNKAFGGIIANAGDMLENTEKTAPRLLGSMVQVAVTNTDFIDSPGMRRCLSKSDFRLSDLKIDPKGVSVFVTLPQRFMETHFRWVRMIINLTTGDIERVKGRPASGHPVLMMLDEFPSLRRLRSVENAAAQSAGHGLKLVLAAQTLAQLKDAYKDSFESLVANAGLKLFFGIDDNFTRDYVSKLAGEQEVYRKTFSQNETKGLAHSVSHARTVGTTRGFTLNDGATFSRSYSTSRSESFATTHGQTRNWSESEGVSHAPHKRALVSPDEVGRLFGDRANPLALVMVTGHQPSVVRRTRYYQDQQFDGWFDPHLDHPPPPTLAERANGAFVVRPSLPAKLIPPRRPVWRIAWSGAVLIYRGVRWIGRTFPNPTAIVLGSALAAGIWSMVLPDIMAHPRPDPAPSVIWRERAPPLEQPRSPLPVRKGSPHRTR